MRKSNQTKTKDETIEAIEYIETQHSLIYALHTIAELIVMYLCRLTHVF